MAGPKFREAHAPDAQRFHAKYDAQHRAQKGAAKTQDSLANAGNVNQAVRVLPSSPTNMDMPEMGASPPTPTAPGDMKALPTTGAVAPKVKMK